MKIFKREEKCVICDESMAGARESVIIADLKGVKRKAHIKCFLGKGSR